MSSLFCPICGQRNDSAGHVFCWVPRPEPTTISPYMPTTMSDATRLSMKDAVARLNAQDKRIVELEQLEQSNGELRREMDAQLAKLEAENARLREAGAKIISAIRFGLSQDELEAMEEFELLLGGGDE